MLEKKRLYSSGMTPIEGEVDAAHGTARVLSTAHVKYAARKPKGVKYTHQGTERILLDVGACRQNPADSLCGVQVDGRGSGRREKSNAARDVQHRMNCDGSVNSRTSPMSRSFTENQRN